MKDRVASFLIQEMREQKDYYNMFYEIYFERAQLYGSLIKLMIDSGIETMVVNRTDLDNASKHILKFTPDRDTDSLTLELVDNIQEEEKDE